MSKILKLAFEELGVKEIPGGTHEDRIVQYARESGIPNINDDETPWCSIFVNWIAFKLGLKKTDSASARSWNSVGKRTDNPQPGDIVVFWRESPTSWKGHVGFFLGFSNDRKLVFCLGGNQGNAVSIQSYDAKKVLQFRVLHEEKNLSIPRPVLKKGSKGVEVEKLQLILNHLGYNCGDADGDFGSKTLKALQIFQADNRIGVDGIYGRQSQTKIESSLQS